MGSEDTKPEPLASTVLDIPAIPIVPRPAEDAPADVHAIESPPAERYEPRGVLGAGGMGEVRLVRDRRIGREVALKVLRERDDDRGPRTTRFVREARIQGQLEHPSVVPVHDLSADERGAVYFTMTRVRGMTLTKVLERLRDGDPEHARRFTRRRLLTAFSSVCLAIDFAHERGVIHRDLKPDNIMLGDHGQVMVLDWGVARVIGEATDDGPPISPDSSLDGRKMRTLLGSVIGTAGYMSPEQAAGAVDEVGPASDVYALGAILFEILTLAQLHDAPSARERLDSTLRGADARASERVPSAAVPPELEAICVVATQHDPRVRMQSARGLSELVEQYLEGDRDVERRRTIAAAHAERARQHAARAFAPGREGIQARTEALREIGRALALDPEHSPAIETLVSLALRTPEEAPIEVERELDVEVQLARRRGAGSAILSSLTWILLIPLGLAMGVRDWWACGVSIALVLLCLIASVRVRRLARISEAEGIALLVLQLLTISSFSMVFGPFLLVPSIALGQVVLFVLIGGMPGRRTLFAALGTAAVVVPWLLELAGVLPPSIRFTDDGMLLVSRIVSFPPVLTTVFLLVSMLALVPVAIWIADQVRESLAAAQRKNLLTLWQLRQMVPDKAHERL
jgi:tRNA A-37 threonylcarbamoyl transferase component Bud32